MMRFPTPSDVRVTLARLLSHEVTVDRGRIPNRQLLGHCTYEVVDHADRLRAIVAVELPLAHSLGAAMAMVAPDQVDDDTPNPHLLECAREAVNVLVGRLAVKNDAELHIDPSADGRRFWSASAIDSSHRITVKGYRPGTLAILEFRRTGLLALDAEPSLPDSVSSFA